MLIRQSLPSLEGYAITSAYQPAQQVGGDFFQLIEQEAGKGPKAAMTVSLIVGAVRMLVESSDDPGRYWLGSIGACMGDFRMDSRLATCIACSWDQLFDLAVSAGTSRRAQLETAL